MIEIDQEEDPRERTEAKATTAANARVLGRYLTTKRNAERKSPPRLAPAKGNSHEPR